MNRIRSDDVELFFGGQNEMTRVIVVDVSARIVQDVVVFAVEVLGGNGGNQGLQLADGDVANVGMDHESAGGDSGAESDDQHGLRVRMDQRRNMADRKS